MLNKFILRIKSMWSSLFPRKYSTNRYYVKYNNKVVTNLSDEQIKKISDGLDELFEHSDQLFLKSNNIRVDIESIVNYKKQ